MLKAVIFDMDGVIIDSEPMHAKAGVLALKKYDVDINIDYCYRFIGTTAYRMCQQMIHDFNLSITPEELLGENEELKQHLLKIEGYPVIPYITDLIKNLYDHGLKLIIASSSPPEAIEYVMNTNKITDYFEGYVSGSHIKKPKPAPDIFLAAAKKLGYKHNECIVIEDSSNGINAAYAANMPSIGFVNPNSGIQDLSKATMLVEGFEEIDHQFIKEVHNRYFGEPINIINTERLIIRELSLEDFDALYEICIEPDISKYIHGFSHNKEDEYEKLKSYINTVYKFYGYGLWGVYLKDTMTLIGRCGIEQHIINGTSEYEISYLISGKYRNRGYGRESCKAIINYFFKRYSIPRISAVIDLNNNESIRLGQILNMKYTSKIVRNNQSYSVYILENNQQ